MCCDFSATLDFETYCSDWRRTGTSLPTETKFDDMYREASKKEASSIRLDYTSRLRKK